MTQKALLQSAGDGTAVPAGYVGQVIQVDLSANTIINSTTESDVSNLSLSLTAGVWLISYSLSADINTTTALGHTNAILAKITDSSNSQIGNSLRCLYVKNNASGTNQDIVGCLSAQEVVNISSSQTYKVRSRVLNASSGGVIQQDAQYGASKFMAVRIA